MAVTQGAAHVLYSWRRPVKALVHNASETDCAAGHPDIQAPVAGNPVTRHEHTGVDYERAARPADACQHVRHRLGDSVVTGDVEDGRCKFGNACRPGIDGKYELPGNNGAILGGDLRVGGAREAPHC